MASELQVPTFHTRASHWSHAVSMPVAARPVSRHPPSFVPGQRLEPGFDNILTLSTLHQRFTCVRLTSAHLTGDSRLFRNAHHPGRWAEAACGGLDPGPATRVRGAFPHLLCSKALQVGTATSSVPPLRTVVAHSRPHIEVNSGELHRAHGDHLLKAGERAANMMPSCCAMLWAEHERGEAMVVFRPPAVVRPRSPSVTVCRARKPGVPSGGPKSYAKPFAVAYGRVPPWRAVLPDQLPPESASSSARWRPASFGRNRYVRRTRAQRFPARSRGDRPHSPRDASLLGSSLLWRSSGSGSPTWSSTRAGPMPASAKRIPTYRGSATRGGRCARRCSPSTGRRRQG